MEIVVVGAGISGCMCAKELSARGHKVTLIDKGKRAGGRMATRRMQGAIIDHGAQFFSARHECFLTLVNVWRAAGLARPWFHEQTDSAGAFPLQRFRGSEGINSPIRELSSGLSVTSNFAVERIDSQGGWTISARDPTIDPLQAEHLVLTLPVPQVLQLLDRSGLSLGDEVMKSLAKVRYTRCLALFGLLQEVSALVHPGYVSFPEPEIDWLCDNFHKGISAKPSFTLHSSDGFARQHWDSSDHQVFSLLGSRAERVLSTTITDWSVHRWKYARPIVTFGASFHNDYDSRITLAGDGFGGGSVERAALSGLQAADAIIDQSR